jgi:hypothetical protein
MVPSNVLGEKEGEWNYDDSITISVVFGLRVYFYYTREVFKTIPLSLGSTQNGLLLMPFQRMI